MTITLSKCTTNHTKQIFNKEIFILQKSPTFIRMVDIFSFFAISSHIKRAHIRVIIQVSFHEQALLKQFK